MPFLSAKVALPLQGADDKYMQLFAGEIMPAGFNNLLILVCIQWLQQTGIIVKKMEINSDEHGRHDEPQEE
jgi:hypothetical protein